MPVVANTLKTFDQVGKAEDVEDIIYDISPTDTVFLSSIGTSTAKATLHQWLQDSLATPAANALVEGADAGAASTVTQEVKTANTQIFGKVVQVSGTAESVEAYGRSSDLALAIAKAGKECKRDIEFAMVGNGQAGTAGNGSTARQLTSAQNQISSATTNTAGSNRALTEALVLDVMQKVFVEGGNPTQMQVTPSHASVVAGFATASGRQRDFGTGTTVVSAVDILVTPFGTISVVPSRQQQANSALIIDPEYWSRAVLRPMTTTVLAKTGDSDKRQLLTELTLVCENDKASGKIDALTA